MQPCTESIVELDTEGEFAYRLEVNKKDLTAALYSNGKKLRNWKNICSEPCEIILTMKNAEIKLDRVFFEYM